MSELGDQAEVETGVRVIIRQTSKFLVCDPQVFDWDQRPPPWPALEKPLKAQYTEWARLPPNHHDQGL